MRTKNRTVSKATPEKVEAGDTVKLLVKQPKHTAREMFLVTEVSGNNISSQKILHPLYKGPTKQMSKVYNTQSKRLKVVHKPAKLDNTLTTEPLPASPQSSKPTRSADPSRRTEAPSQPWSTVNDAFYDRNISDAEDDNACAEDELRQNEDEPQPDAEDQDVQDRQADHHDDADQ